ncbi:MAG: alpha/beta hydrolase-fold protein [Phycisphaerales bacterium]|nr:alpha/beta hydrolase-fold protein [Phycisphaerales bacterium]
MKIITQTEELKKQFHKSSQQIYSEYLGRKVTLDVYTIAYNKKNSEASLLLVNDGQDLPTMNFDQILIDTYLRKTLTPLIIVGIHCGPAREHEYGTAFCANYKNYGDQAGLYTKFIMDELLPSLKYTLSINEFKEKSFAGFSLGALSALDIVWNNAVEFSKVGVFSGSLWWRRKAYDAGYIDQLDKLMHLQIRKGKLYPWLKFYLQCGGEDEAHDRNNNGIIDSIDDTKDLITCLLSKGYSQKNICYVENPHGKHNLDTWAQAFPKFLEWGWHGYEKKI